MSNVKVAFKNVMDKRAVYKPVDKEYLSSAVYEYARLYCKDAKLYEKILREKVVIRLNGKVIDVDNWSTTILKDNDKILVTPALEGDSGGLLGIVLGAALIAASFFVPPAGAGLSILGATVNSSVFLMGAAVFLGGIATLLMQPDLPTLSSVGGSKGSTTYSWSGISTQARPDMPIPIVYGKHSVGGNVISIFTERQGSDDYLYMLLALCEGEIEGICTEENTDNICTTSDYTSANYKHPYILLDDQPFQNYTDIEWWYRTGTNLPNALVDSKDPSAQNIIPGFSGSRMQIDDGRKLSTDGIIYTTTKEVDMATVQIRFPSLYDSTGGTVNNTTLSYKIEYKKNGTATWYTYGQDRFDPIITAQSREDGTTSPSYGWTNISYISGTPGVQSGNSYILDTQKPDSIWFRVTSVSQDDINFIEDGNFRFYATKNYNFDLQVKNLTTNETYTKKITHKASVEIDFYTYLSRDLRNSITTKNTQIQLGAYTLLSPLTPRVGDTYILSSTQSSKTWIEINAKSKTGLWDARTLDFHTLANGEGKQVYDIRVTRQQPVSGDFQISNDAILNSVIEIVNGDFIYPNTALLGFKIKATGQLSGSPPNVVVMLKGLKIKVPDLSGTETFGEVFWDETDDRWEYDGSERTWDNTTYTTEYSNNPMLCLRDLMRSKRYGLGEYTSNSDFSDANTISIIKECHKEYNPTEEDFVKWWTAGNDFEFVKNIENGMTSNIPNTLSISASSRTVTYSGAYTHYLPIRIDAPFKSGQKYQLSITLSGTSSNVDIDLCTRAANSVSHPDTWFQFGNWTAPEISDAGDGTSTYSFTAPSAGTTHMLLIIRKHGGPANINGVIDDVSIDSIQGSGSNRAWHYHTFNGVFDARQSALSALVEFTNAFRVWPSWYEGTFQFIMDKDETPIHTISINNTVSFSQSWVPLSEIPYKILGQFTDEDHNYTLTQMAVLSSDTTIPKVNEQTVGLKGITNKKRAERELKFKLSKFTNSTHSINIRCGMDMIHATAGDIINVSNDLPSWGHGSRVASYNAASKFIYLTEAYTVLDATPVDLMIKYQDVNNDYQTATLNITGITDGDVLRRVTTKTWPGNPIINGNSVLGINTSYVKKFRLLSVTRADNEEIEANALEHISTLYGSEPTLRISQEFETHELDMQVGKPRPPINIEVTQLPAIEGIGWAVSAEHADLRSQEIIVEFSENSDSFTPIGSILQGSTSLRYINNNLEIGKTYKFKFTAKGLTGNSSSVYQTVILEKVALKVNPVTGIQIKGASPLSQTWDGLDVTITWNPVGQDTTRSGLLDFYTIYVYGESYDPKNPRDNLLRTAYSKKTEYRYTYDMNLEDNGTAVPHGTLIFVITANLINGIESERSRPFLVTNAAPNSPTNLNSKVWMRTVEFSWNPDGSTDFKHFRMRNKIVGNTGTPVGNWSTWENKKDNFFSRVVSGTELNTYGEAAKIFFEVKTVDFYNSSSNIASTNNNVQTLSARTGDIATFAITGPQIQASAVSTEKIAVSAVTTLRVAANAITADKIEASAVTANKIAANAVESDKIAANAVTADKINVASLSAITADMGTITAGLAKSVDGRFQVDFTNAWIKVFDASASLRVQLGYIP